MVERDLNSIFIFILTCLDLQRNPVEGFSAGLVEDNIYEVKREAIFIVGYCSLLCVQQINFFFFF